MQESIRNLIEAIVRQGTYIKTAQTISKPKTTALTVFLLPVTKRTLDSCYKTQVNIICIV